MCLKVLLNALNTVNAFYKCSNQEEFKTISEIHESFMEKVKGNNFHKLIVFIENTLNCMSNNFIKLSSTNEAFPERFLLYFLCFTLTRIILSFYLESNKITISINFPRVPK